MNTLEVKSHTAVWEDELSESKKVCSEKILSKDEDWSDSKFTSYISLLESLLEDIKTMKAKDVFSPFVSTKEEKRLMMLERREAEVLFECAQRGELLRQMAADSCVKRLMDEGYYDVSCTRVLQNKDGDVRTITYVPKRGETLSYASSATYGRQYFKVSDTATDKPSLLARHYKAISQDFELAKGLKPEDIGCFFLDLLQSKHIPEQFRGAQERFYLLMFYPKPKANAKNNYVDENDYFSVKYSHSKLKKEVELCPYTLHGTAYEKKAVFSDFALEVGGVLHDKGVILSSKRFIAAKLYKITTTTDDDNSYLNSVSGKASNFSIKSKSTGKQQYKTDCNYFDAQMQQFLDFSISLYQTETTC